MKIEFAAPTVTDYGTLVDITAAAGFVNQEDGGSKLLIHHVEPSTPLGP